VAVWAEQSEILRLVLAAVAADVVHVERHAPTGRVDLVPAAFFAPLASRQDQRLANAGIWLALPCRAGHLAR